MSPSSWDPQDATQRTSFCCELGVRFQELAVSVLTQREVRDLYHEVLANKIQDSEVTLM